MTRVKICGLTNDADVMAAIAAGADALGFVLAESPRRVTLETACRLAALRSPFISSVAVFLNASTDEVLIAANSGAFDFVQLHGNESPDDVQRVLRETHVRVIKRIRVSDSDDAQSLTREIARHPNAIPLIDPGAGSGKIFRWEIARGLSPALILSGGLTPENVAEAIRVVEPYAVDVASGVESAPGAKDAARMSAFVKAAKAFG